MPREKKPGHLKFFLILPHNVPPGKCGIKSSIPLRSYVEYSIETDLQMTLNVKKHDMNQMPTRIFT
jgi:hypothetical protein